VPGLGDIGLRDHRCNTMVNPDLAGHNELSDFTRAFCNRMPEMRVYCNGYRLSLGSQWWDSDPGLNRRLNGGQ
jgi:hypothetical protein